MRVWVQLHCQIEFLRCLNERNMFPSRSTNSSVNRGIQEVCRPAWVPCHLSRYRQGLRAVGVYVILSFCHFVILSFCHMQPQALIMCKALKLISREQVPTLKSNEKRALHGAWRELLNVCEVRQSQSFSFNNPLTLNLILRS
jgi:hypothetical protein